MGRQHQKEREHRALVLQTVAIALAARGIGHDTTSRIIRKLRVSEDRVLRRYLEAEQNCMQTLWFWD